MAELGYIPFSKEGAELLFQVLAERHEKGSVMITTNLGGKMSKKSFKQLFEEARKGEDYWIASAIVDFTDNLCKLMEEKKVTKAEISKRMDVAPSYITKILRGNANFTISSMVRLARAVGGRLHLHIAPENIAVKWIENYERISEIRPLDLEIFQRPTQESVKTASYVKVLDPRMATKWPYFVAYPQNEAVPAGSDLRDMGGDVKGNYAYATA